MKYEISVKQIKEGTISISGNMSASEAIAIVRTAIMEAGDIEELPSLKLAPTFTVNVEMLSANDDQLKVAFTNPAQ